MDKEISKHPEWALAQKRKGTELRCINGRYYLYEVSSKWNPEKKKSVKITGKLLGSITEKNGFVESEKAILKRQQVKIDKIKVKEYGVSALIKDVFKEQLRLLKKHFPDSWQSIVSLAYGRLLHQSSLKNMFFHYSHSFLSETVSEVDLSSKRIGLFLKELGYERDKMVSYFREFKQSEDCILFDGTDIFSASQQMDLPKLAKSKIGTFDTVINIMCVFSIKQQLPIYYRLLPGNIKDIKSFSLCLMESQIKDAIVIIDKGFASDKNIASLENENLKYIIPLPRNSRYIDYQKITDGDKRKFDGYFRFENRFIWYYSNIVDGKKVNVYLDEELRNREQRDYLNRIENKVDNFSIEKFHEKQHSFGTIAIIENVKKTPEEVYFDYKTRAQVETMIDALKNVVEADRTYMQNSYSLEGWMFINHIALQWYYFILQLLREHKLNTNFSVKDILQILLEVKHVCIDDKWYPAEITKTTAKLLAKLNIKHIT